MKCEGIIYKNDHCQPKEISFPQTQFLGSTLIGILDMMTIGEI